MRYIRILLIFIALSSFRSEDDRTVNFPAFREKVPQLPQKENLWIFVLAGQSNMAGRGFVEPKDTIPNDRIISLGEDMTWYYAKEPLHFYEPDLTGLDCGLSFARELLKFVPDNVTIGLIPCAVGGSAVAQWNNDETYRNVTLLTNFTERVDTAQTFGTIKGILWHQGESDAHSDKIPLYKDAIEILFGTFRNIAEDDALPILAGELGAFREPVEVQLQCDSINSIIHESAASDKYRFVISTKDLSHRGDHLHFNSESQREMGVRFADKYAAEVLHETRADE